ncbi:hypothetical protein GCM10009784_30200 [Arthrobacter parietis]|uniref:Uncharacterized protein n=1 Tax=Arthrobacter parietis TaxID=271434 RepID=A0ABN3B0G4_9MICC
MEAAFFAAEEYALAGGEFLLARFRSAGVQVCFDAADEFGEEIGIEAGGAGGELGFDRVEHGWFGGELCAVQCAADHGGCFAGHHSG